MSTIGSIICDSRKNKALTQEELAEAATVNLRTIQRIENNQNIPRGKTLTLICEALGLSLEQVQLNEKEEERQRATALFANGFFLLLFNLAFASIIGYMTMDSDANLNSRIGAHLLSILIAFVITYKTPKMNGLRRMMLYGNINIVYAIAAIVLQGNSSFTTGLLSCILLSLATLYYGEHLLNSRDKQTNY